MRIYTLGTSHGATEKGRACSATLLEVNKIYYLLDCGGNVEEKMTDMELPIENIKSVFISHMHEDHVGTLSSIVKRFTVYLNKEEPLEIYFPETAGLEAFENWINALHFPVLKNKISLKLSKASNIYYDGNISVKSIPTKHIENGKFPSFAYVVRTADKKILYTGDLSPNFSDYPEILFEEEFDAVICELVHFNFEENINTLIKTKTKKMIFTHLSLENIPKIKAAEHLFDFEINIAEDGKCFEI